MFSYLPGYRATLGMGLFFVAMRAIRVASRINIASNQLSLVRRPDVTVHDAYS